MIDDLWQYQKTVLMHAAQGGSIEIVNRLLELGADPLAAARVKFICIDCACWCTYYLVFPLWLIWL